MTVARSPAGAHALVADLADALAVDAIVAALGELPPASLLVNNAGITRDGRVERLSEDDVRAVIAVNLVRRCGSPSPWGLVRHGVAPDHPKVKSVTRVFEKTAAKDAVRFHGNVDVGTDVGHEELARAYHAVLYAIGEGVPPLPNTTPHTLRRTYISIALLANNFDVKWVMGQVGHADSKMTLDVYAQLEQRVDRSHGTSFDRLISQARDQLDGLIGSPSGHNAQIEPADARQSAAGEKQEEADLQPDPPMASPRLELGTPRFSVVCSTN